MAGRSLFARLLLMQALLVLALMLLFGLLFYTERNIAVARLLADRWAPVLRQAAGLPGDTDIDTLPVRHSDRRPPGAVATPGLTPRITALRRSLLADGVPLQGLAIEPGADRATVWVAIALPGGGQRWLGFDDWRLIEPRAAGRLLVALPLALLLLSGASWLFTRRLTRPLARLRDRIAAHRPGTTLAAAPPAEPDASPEIVAIDAAWRELHERLARHEHERLLMLAGVSHDLRSPLARIRMAAALLPDEPAVAARRDSIVHNVQVADRLIQAFLDHARLGTLVLDQTVDLAALARRVAADAGDLPLQAPQTLLLPGVHPLLLERVLANLVDNALKHGRPPVQLRVAAQPGAAVLEVEDAGPGIPAAQRATLMQAFARGDASRGKPGTGLGLAIVRDGAERLGAAIEFEQPAGGGFIVRLRLPTTRS